MARAVVVLGPLFVSSLLPGQSSSRLWIFGATLVDESGLTAQADVLYFVQSGEALGFTANWNLAAGQQDLIAVHFKGVPGGRGREGRVVVPASAGWTGGTHEAGFSNAFALEDERKPK